MDTMHLSLDVSGAPGALARVVGLCQRRGCEVIALHYHHGDRHRPGLLDVALRGDPRRLRLVAARLEGLWDCTTR